METVRCEIDKKGHAYKDFLMRCKICGTKYKYHKEYHDLLEHYKDNKLMWIVFKTQDFDEPRLFVKCARHSQIVWIGPLSTMIYKIDKIIKTAADEHYFARTIDKNRKLVCSCGKNIDDCAKEIENNE